MKEKKTIYDLDLHEATIIEEDGDAPFHRKWRVTRVPTGWLYINDGGIFSFFVPANDFKRL